VRKELPKKQPLTRAFTSIEHAGASKKLPTQDQLHPLVRELPE
jgi:hypothetical protein